VQTLCVLCFFAFWLLLPGFSHHLLLPSLIEQGHSVSEFLRGCLAQSYITCWSPSITLFLYISNTGGFKSTNGAAHYLWDSSGDPHRIVLLYHHHTYRTRRCQYQQGRYCGGSCQSRCISTTTRQLGRTGKGFRTRCKEARKYQQTSLPTKKSPTKRKKKKPPRYPTI